ncbi:MAG: RluA family pseudouridine synthase [Bacteriovoracia bacterium]
MSVQKPIKNRLDLFVSQKEGVSRSQAQQLIKDSNVTVNGKIVTKTGHLVSNDDKILVHIPKPKSLDLSATDLSINVLYEDEDLAVVYKPAGLSVHPSTTETGSTLVHGLLYSLKELSSVGGVERPGIVHRIDKGTSGILVISKNDFSHSHLSSQFKKHTVERIYWAIVCGNVFEKLKKKSGRIESKIARSKTNRKKFTAKTNSSSARNAITNWKILEQFQFFTLMELKLETGRTHQIRVHLSELGFPILGDPLYGDSNKAIRHIKDENLKTNFKEIKHQLLHAKTLRFLHPKTEKTLAFDSELPDDFALVLKDLQQL